ncbi:hypothetical protein BB560_003429 [Smittium megazygosporum]|uniref:T-complex protein 1 subunit gamma n=1 Tax=Smittium megazygosporum TaxID=133381 RepID=A0A2T9ZBZ9_9FUNG|nr:hypothetical protein BB560_003429 [Smittium megazygosporum]
MQSPMIVLNTNKQRESGQKAQLSNIAAAKTIADIVRTCLGPRAMLKMMLDPMGGITLTNDGHTILRECEAAHPAAKSVIELSRTQDEEVGDGTTSVIVLAGEMLTVAAPLLQRHLHPVTIISGYRKALEDADKILESISIPVDTTSEATMLGLIKSAIGTKFVSNWNDLMCSLALKAVKSISSLGAKSLEKSKAEIDIKRYVRVEKIPGGEIEESAVLDEYKKNESQTNIEISKESDWNRILQIEEEQIIALSQHYLVKAGISAIRRVRKMDNHRISRATGASIATSVFDLKESDIGTECGLFEVRKIGDEYYSFLVECKNPKACSILLRGPTKDTLNEIDRNLQDAMSVARNVMVRPLLCPGGGASEMALSVLLSQKAKSSVPGVEQLPYLCVADAMEVIPRTLTQNCGGNAIKVLTSLRAKHSEGEHTWGVDGETGKVVDMKTFGIWEPISVKSQTVKTSIESACLLLRVDDIVAATSKKSELKSVSDE